MRIAWLVAALIALPAWAQQAPASAALAAPPEAGFWRESTPEQQGMDGAKMAALRQHLEAGAIPQVRSVLVVRHDTLVFEYGRKDVQRDDLQHINSATKSVVSALVGVALQRGAFKSLDQPVADFLPEAHAPGIDPRVRTITIRHLLTMSSGFAWDEKARDACGRSRSGECARFEDGGEPTAFALRRPLAQDPGKAFNYDSPSVNLLAVTLARATGMPLQAFAQETLARDLGIAKLRWETDPQGNFLGGRGIQATARDMAKFGNLFLRRGAWQGKQVVPAEYVDAATRGQIAGGWPWPPWAQYGYLWWVIPGRGTSYAANGAGGQYLWVFPAQDAVVVITADPLERTDTSVLVRDFIGPAFGPR